MSGIVAIIYWDSATVDGNDVRRMLASVPHRLADGSQVALGKQCSMGFARFATTLRELAAVQPLYDEESAIWCVGDVRLDNREELHRVLREESRQLPANEIPSDPELLVRGYRYWGRDLAQHLVGDFAFVLWDERDRTLYAARDPFGSRPLFYHWNATRLVFATEVAQILSLENFERKVEDRVVVDYLSENYRHDRETFFQNIFRVLPGHYLVCQGGEPREVRYWQPLREPLHLGRPEDYYEEFRRLLQQSTADRLESDGRPIIAHLSGGLDSTSVVCMADLIYGQASAVNPPIYAASALFPGLACDETHYIDAVARKIRFPSIRWDGTVPDWEELKNPYLGDPFRDVQSGFYSGLYSLASREDVRVVLTGEGGDQLLTEYGVFRDLAASHRWLRLFHESLSIHRATKRGWKRWVKDGIRYTSPKFLQHAYTSFRAAQNTPPAWLACRLREHWPRLSWAPQVLSGNAWHSHTQQCTWELLTSQYSCWLMEWRELRAARRGLCIRSPFFDKRLVRFVLAIPFEHRLPGGRWKLLLRKAMASILPAEVADREGFTVFTSNVNLQFKRQLPMLQSIIFGGKIWCSEQYVDRFEAQKLLKEVAAEETPCAGLHGQAVWNIAMLELWLRRIDSA